MYFVRQPMRQSGEDSAETINAPHAWQLLRELRFCLSRSSNAACGERIKKGVERRRRGERLVGRLAHDRRCATSCVSGHCRPQCGLASRALGVLAGHIWTGGASEAMA